MQSETALPPNRVSLRPCTTLDIPGLMEGLNDWQVAQWLPRVPFPYTEADARAFVASSAQTSPPDAFAIVHQAGGEFAGIVGLARSGAIGELGYWLLPRCQHRGLMSEALRLLIEHHCGSLRSLFATVDPGNTACLALLARSGFHLTGEHIRATANRQGNIVVLGYQKDLG
ncbi:GNAT family N-acetyltransferase [Pleomorphomonas sp. PLEO]|uniref:GNAT family N-acetyltransferase n=1 Tax=Pleomorphomonas sp. PLEO TaxID=3239306 RepID=UPI00351F370B